MAGLNPNYNSPRLHVGLNLRNCRAEGRLGFFTTPSGFVATRWNTPAEGMAWFTADFILSIGNWVVIIYRTFLNALIPQKCRGCVNCDHRSYASAVHGVAVNKDFILRHFELKSLVSPPPPRHTWPIGNRGIPTPPHSRTLDDSCTQCTCKC